MKNFRRNRKSRILVMEDEALTRNCTAENRAGCSPTKYPAAVVPRRCGALAVTMFANPGDLAQKLSNGTAAMTVSVPA